MLSANSCVSHARAKPVQPAGVIKIGPRKKLLSRARDFLKDRKGSAAGKYVVPECAVCLENFVTSAMVLDNLSVPLHMLCALYVGLCALWL